MIFGKAEGSSIARLRNRHDIGAAVTGQLRDIGVEILLL
jgi:hypothetical protein